MILTRIRRGFDKTGAPFTPLAASTIERRKKKSLHPTTSPDRSNLTETGKMGDDLLVKVRGTGKLSVEIAPASQKKAREHIRGKKNLPVRDFMGITSRERQKIKEEIRKILVKSFK